MILQGVAVENLGAFELHRNTRPAPGDCRLRDHLGSRRGLLNHLVTPGDGFRGLQRNGKEERSIGIVEPIEPYMPVGALITQLQFFGWIMKNRLGFLQGFKTFGGEGGWIGIGNRGNPAAEEDVLEERLFILKAPAVQETGCHIRGNTRGLCRDQHVLTFDGIEVEGFLKCRFD